MASIQGIYVALFGRPADPAGLAYFNEATNNGANLDAIGDLAKTDEYQSRFANMTNEEIVNSIYKSLFERDGEKAGIDFYVGELAAGRLNINNIAIAILDGAKNDDLTTVNAKIAAADIFTSHLDLNAEVEAYRGTFAAQVGREFLDTVTKDDAGTPAEADTAILRLFPDQGQQPGGGGVSPGSGPQPTFVIHDGENGITFDGTATGNITLGQKPNGSTPVIVTFTSKSESTILTGERGTLHIKATFDPADTTVDATHGVHIASLESLKSTDSLKLTDDLHVSLSAATADGHAISGAGSVCVSGSEGDQHIQVTTTGYNHIEGGLGADDVTVGDGHDAIQINGVSQDLIDNANEAQSTLDGLIAQEPGLQEAVDTAQGAIDAANQDLASKQGALDALEATHQGLLDDLNTANGELTAANDDLSPAQQDVTDAENEVAAAQDAIADANDSLSAGDMIAIKAGIGVAFATAFLGDSNAHRAAVTNYINKLDIPDGAKTALIETLPSGDFVKLVNHLGPYLNGVDGTINTYKSGLATDLTNAQDHLDGAEQHLTDVNTAISDANHHIQTAQDALTQYDLDHQAKQDAVDAAQSAADNPDLAQHLTDANAALEANHEQQAAAQETLNTIAHIENDSMAGDNREDSIHHFTVGSDTLHLPGHDVVSVEENSFDFNYHDQNIHVQVTNGVVAFSIDEVETAVTGDNLTALLNYLSNDKVVADGQTLAFDYGDGVYVFQGHAGEADIGVKLVGLELADLHGNVSSLFAMPA